MPAPTGKPVTLGVRLETALASDFRELCAMKHIAPSTMIRVLIHRYVEECGFTPDPLELADATGRDAKKRKPRGTK